MGSLSEAAQGNEGAAASSQTAALTRALCAAGLWPHVNLLAVSTIDSTNRLARRLLDSLADESEPVPPLLVVALQQSAGRGRAGRTWSSPADLGLYATRVVRLESMRSATQLPLLVPVAVSEALDWFLRRPCGIKWPNDLVVGGRKLGGILIETVAGRSSGGAALIGVGVNVAQLIADLPGPEATSLALETGQAPALPGVAAAVLARLEDTLGGGGEGIVERFRQRLVHRRGETVTFRVGDEMIVGEYLGVDDLGHLRLRCDGSARTFASGEVIER